MVLSQVKGLTEYGCMPNGAQVKKISDLGTASARERSSEESSTTHYQVQDISRADFKAIGASFQVSRSCTLRVTLPLLPLDVIQRGAWQILI